MDRRMDRRTVARGASAVAGAAALGLFPTSAEAAVESGKHRKSLYDRLGGYFGIAAVVNRFTTDPHTRYATETALGVERNGAEAGCRSQVRWTL